MDGWPTCSGRTKRDMCLAGQYSHYRHRHHGQPSIGVPPDRFFAYLQTHDQVGNRPHGIWLGHLVAWEPLKLAAGVLLLSPYPPLLFMGEEYAETAPFHFFTDHGDPGLVERVRAGRQRKTAPQLKEEPADPTGRKHVCSFQGPSIAKDEGRHRTLWHYYRQLLHCAATPAPRRGARESWVAGFEAERFLLSRSEFDESGAWVVFSLPRRPVTLTAAGPLLVAAAPQSGVWRRQFDSAAAEWQGPGAVAAEVWRPGDA